MSKSIGVASSELVAACESSANGLALARQEASRWIPVDPSEVSTMRACGDEPLLVAVELNEGGGLYDTIDADDL